MLIKVLDSALEKKYEDFLLSSAKTLFFASNRYRKFLRSFLKETDHYFVALNNKEDIVGALPAFLKQNEEFGPVLNSLPFYGSNGGMIEFRNDVEVRNALLDAFYSLAAEKGCSSSTIISSPLDTQEELYENKIAYSFRDSRIGQLSPLPAKDEAINDSVMKMIDSKMRNLIRKAQKLQIEVHSDERAEVFKFMLQTHQENMQAIGGTAKPDHFFNAIPDHFEYGKDYKIYYAKKDGQLMAAVLLFYFNRTVEYFTPVIKAEFRSSQPLSLLIFEAMKDAVNSGYNWWNWGGTWASQDGVYHFKSQWGTKDIPYYYYTTIHNTKILSNPKDTLLKAYPYFFVAPFNQVKTATS